MTNSKVTMKYVLTTLLMVGLVFFADAQGKKKRETAGYTKQDYEITCIGVGDQGTKLMAVYGYGKKPEIAVREAKRNAIHGVIFKGAQTSSGGCQGVKPLAKSVTLETSRADFFEKFFEDGGPYLKFIAASAQGEQMRSVVKVDKKTYKVGIAVAVMYDALRKELENAGVIKGLSSGF